MNRVYMDYAATTPTHPEVLDAMLPYFTDIFGNPSSLYACGLEARRAINEVRQKIADFIGAATDEIVFTSGGSEADNLALEGVAYAQGKKGRHIITSSIEHHAVLRTCEFLEKRGFQVTYLPVDAYGLVDPEMVRRAITPETILISIMHANNEIGTIEPLSAISKIARENHIPLHSDAVQTLGHLPIDVKELGVDMLSMSAHKLYGPKGVGALYIHKGIRITSFLHGGEQEKGRRAGTENVPGIVGLGKAIEIAQKEMAEEAIRLTGLRERLIQGLMQRIDHMQLNGHPTKRLPNNASFNIEYVEGESMLLRLDLEGICVSTGSACSSSSLEPSHVLLATGCPREQAHGSLRLTIGKWTTEAEIDRILEVLPRIVKQLRDMSPLYKN
jgi:cysteine desulfurase